MSKTRLYTRQQIIAKAIEQNHLCLYCLLPFGYVCSYRNNLNQIQFAVGDHFTPYAYSQETQEQNLVAACALCNSFKGSLIFRELPEVQRYINRRFLDKKVVIEWIPETAHTEDSEQWSKEYQIAFSSDFYGSFELSET